MRLMAGQSLSASVPGACDALLWKRGRKIGGYCTGASISATKRVLKTAGRLRNLPVSRFFYRHNA
jgi:hypothetical protein